jgi:hypothetical protein
VKKDQKKAEDWMQTKWRPMMGWSYMLTCIADFVAFPVLWSVLQALQGGEVTSQWNPITLQGAGLYHVAMGAVLGVAAWSRGQEKIAGTATNSAPSFAAAPAPSFAAAPAPSFAAAPAPSFAEPATTGYNGLKAPPKVTDYPEI